MNFFEKRHILGTCQLEILIFYKDLFNLSRKENHYLNMKENMNQLNQPIMRMKTLIRLFTLELKNKDTLIN